MKPTLSLYFFRRIISTVSLLWLALWALLLFFDLLRNADNDGFLNTFIMALLQSPQSAMETLPFACAIGSTLAIRRMVRDGEMAALRTAGLSPVVIVTLQL
ncbi:MAG: LptF/LptG family permease, partial [Proteobacteria bacterium]|nr:LptF/LptG family permease [Pseudomonadota bacterium]